MRIILILLLLLLLLFYIKYTTIRYKCMAIFYTNKKLINFYLLKIYDINSKFLLYISSDLFKELLFYIKIPYKFIEFLKVCITFINAQLKKYLKKI